MTPDRIARALAEATREARTEIIPDIDWETLEERLPMTRVATLPPRPISWRPALLAAALTITGAVLAVGWVRGHAAAPPAEAGALSPARAPHGNAELDGDSLAPGARITAQDAPQTVAHRGHVKWTLAPHSSALLLTQGDVVAIRLEVGSVASRVVKSARIETFAVEAADVRIAAHGTEFVVTLGRDGVSVSVTEGSVLVGPRDQPGVGELLASPSAKNFTLAGALLEPKRVVDSSPGLDALRPGRPPRSDAATADATTNAAPATPTAEEPKSNGSGAVASLSGPKARAKPLADAEPSEAIGTEDERSHVPEKPTPAALEKATSDVVRLAAACFKQRTATSDGVRVTAQTTITFRTLPEGGVQSVSFEPPLSPWVQACITTSVSGVHTEATRYGFQVSRTVDFER